MGLRRKGGYGILEDREKRYIKKEKKEIV